MSPTTVGTDDTVDQHNRGRVERRGTQVSFEYRETPEVGSRLPRDTVEGGTVRVGRGRGRSVQ